MVAFGFDFSPRCVFKSAAALHRQTRRSSSGRVLGSRRRLSEIPRPRCYDLLRGKRPRCYDLLRGNLLGRCAETSADDFSLLDAPSCCCAFFCQRIGSLIETFLVGFHHLYGTYRGPTWPIWDLYVTYRGQGTYIYTQYSLYGTYGTIWASGLIQDVCWINRTYNTCAIFMLTMNDKSHGKRKTLFSLRFRH